VKNLILLSIYLVTSLSLFSQKHWESIILAGDTWSYLPALSEPPVKWNKTVFDDSSWKTGPGGFGYGDGDDATVTSAVNSIYLRKKFKITDTSIIDQLLLDIDYDDAFVLYLNGTEVARSPNITANPPLFNSPLITDHEALLYRGLLPERYVLKPTALKTGDNVLAVQILNVSTASSDMSSLVFLNGRINSSATIYHPVPAWFVAPATGVESNLPLIIINTLGQTILDGSKITAKMTLINNTTGLNNINDTTFDYNGYIGIDTRGSSSLMFEKKSFNVETRTETGANLNVSLIGLPSENDWVLYAPYSDKTLMRNVLVYNLGNLTGRWSPHTRFCELYLNNEYRGVYVLMEKIKRDKNRVNIASLKPADIAGDQLTGGYILKIDRPDSGAWISPYKARNDIQDVPVSYVDPKFEDLVPQQRTYIKEYVTGFENALRGIKFKDPVLGYRAYINMQSFVDYYILNEICRNLDAYRLSTFFYKDKDSKGGKITMGPFWDYDISLGNADFFNAGSTIGWVVDGLGNGDLYGIPFWWDKLNTDPYFKSELKKRWNELRSDKFSNQNINKSIDSCSVLLTDAQQRNFQKFAILNSYVWPNNYIGGTYANEVTYLKSWIKNRFTWMDSQISLFNIISGVQPLYSKVFEVITSPNPFNEKVTIQFSLLSDSKVVVLVQDVLGRTIISHSKKGNTGKNEIILQAGEFNDGAKLYLYKLIVNGEIAYSGKLIKN
jgi:hypothetical protein